VNRFEKKKKAIEQAIRDRIDSYKAIYKKADDEDRDPTDDERLEIESHLKAIETLKVEKEEAEENIKTLQGVEDIGRTLGPAVGSVSVGDEPHDRFVKSLQKTIGEQFTDSAGYKAAISAYREAGRLPSGFSTGAVALEAKGTLLEGAGAPGSGTGGGLIPVPQVVPGVVETLFQQLRLVRMPCTSLPPDVPRKSWRSSSIRTNTERRPLM